METVCRAALHSFKKKKGFRFWNNDLRIKRNYVSSLYKIYIRAKFRDYPEALILEAGNSYGKARAEHRRMLLKAKKDSWESFCVRYSENFGILFKMSFKGGSKCNDILVNPRGDSNLSAKERVELLMNHFFPPNTITDLSSIYNPMGSPIGV
ncbi:hypothetical protein AVEN_19198-1 [Araneus ventricosus]|uniref:Uncharacterized protein n=1 Tax=Araneus ventricosus TaxID=182803 RepID=A0A4Y2UTP9_ARAVE|nr:hypothetical protein AVEN_19198-1 [Araneus ventricosus]